jgi:hypothetical protein
MSEEDNKDWDPRLGWAQNFKKYRYFNAILPALGPMGMVGVFFFGYGTFGLAAIVLAAFSWFDYSNHSKKKYGPILWRIVALAAAPWGIYMLVLQFVPSIRSAS